MAHEQVSSRAAGARLGSVKLERAQRASTSTWLPIDGCFAGEGISAWMAWVTGAVIAVIGLLNFDEDSSWPAWANIVAGLWAVIAPWATHFAAVEAAMWSHVIVGLVVIATSLAKLYGHNWTPRVPA